MAVPRSRPRWVLERPEYWALPLLVALVFLLRYLTLRELPYPPSADAAGDLVWLHTYLGHPLPGYTLVEAPPPVYFFVVVDPAITLAGTFAGIEIIMALVPALLAIPGFYLMRWAGFERIPSFLAAALLATSSAFSEMVAWNSAFNATGILFLAGFLSVLVLARSRPGWRTAIAAGILLALVAGSHIVTFLYALAFLAAYLLLLLLLGVPDLRGRLRWFARMGFVAWIGWLPFAYAYYTNFLITANVGPPGNGSAWQELVFVYSQSVGFPWGTNSPLPGPALVGLVVFLDMLLTVLALPLVWTERRNREVAVLTTSLFAAALFLAALDPGNAIRAVYFLPLAYVPALAAWAARWHPPRPLVSAVRTRARWAPARPMRPYLLAAAGTIFVLANVVVSSANLQQSEQFYLELTPDKIHALTWIGAHTPSNATFYDAANLQTWLLGYAERLSYSPSPLSSKVTSSSYQNAFEANLIDLGAYVISNPWWYFTSNVPGVYNSPGLFVRTDSYWAPVWLGESDTTVLEVLDRGSLVNLTLSYGQDLRIAGGVGANGTATMGIDYRFPAEGLSVTETMALAGPTASVGFSVANGTLEAVRAIFRTPPSGYFYDYAPYGNESVAGSLVQQILLPFSGTISVTTTAAGLAGTVSTEGTGWSSLNVSMSGGVRFVLGGYGGVPGATPFFANTLAVARGLGISYFVVSSQTDYPLFERYFAMVSQGYLVMPTVYTSGPISILYLP